VTSRDLCQSSFRTRTLSLSFASGPVEGGAAHEVLPNGIWANPQGTRVFAVHETSNDLRVIDTGTSRVIAKVPVGRKPIRVVVSR